MGDCVTFTLRLLPMLFDSLQEILSLFVTFQRGVGGWESGLTEL